MNSPSRKSIVIASTGTLVIIKAGLAETVDVAGESWRLQNTRLSRKSAKERSPTLQFRG